jgi:DNA replication and repair protein RecF
MYIRTITLEHLRNHEQSSLECSPLLNIITGLNGSGKTTILEAISICGLSKTFLPSADSDLIKKGFDSYTVGVQAISDLGIPYRVGVHYKEGSRKLIHSSLGDRMNPKDILGEIPLIVLSPDFKEITFGAPDDRRRFMDALLSQARKVYVDDAITLKKIIKQRNALLYQAKIQGVSVDKGLFGVLTDQLIEYGARIGAARASFIEEFTPHFLKAYQTMCGTKETVSIEYIPDTQKEKKLISFQDFKDSYTIAAQLLEIDEYRRATTLFGPQKDDIQIMIHGGRARETASQGQHKSLLISIKWAEFTYLQEVRNETPILLFDDIFSELDAERTHRVLEQVLESGAQTFITTTEGEKLIESVKGEYTLFTLPFST